MDSLILLVRQKIYFQGISTANYGSTLYQLKDRRGCTPNKISLEVLWGTLSRNGPEATRLYLRHKENNDSVVAGLSGDVTPVLFLGDMNSSGQRLLFKYARNNIAKYKGGILFAGHHGYPNGINEELLRFIRPKKVVISRPHARPMIQKDLETIDRSKAVSGRRQ